MGNELQMEQKVELMQLNYQLKLSYAEKMHGMKIDILKKQFSKEQGMLGLKNLIANKKITSQQSKNMWDKAIRIFV